MSAPSDGFPWKEFRFALWLPVYLLIFFLLENTLPASGYWNTALPVDDAIPFCEWFLIPYCSWYLFQVSVGLYTMTHDVPAYRRYMYFLAVTFFASTILWVLFPSGQDLRPAVLPRDNLLCQGVAFLYSIDTNTNVFPSVHVVGAIGASLALWDCSHFPHRRIICWGATVLSFLICLSTLMIKQHALLDVLGALALAAVVTLLVYRDWFVRRV